MIVGRTEPKASVGVSLSMRCSLLSRSWCVLAVLSGLWPAGAGALAIPDTSPDAGRDAEPSSVTPSRPVACCSAVESRAPCERVTLELDAGLSAADVAAIRRALSLKRPEVIISVHYYAGTRSQVLVTTNQGSKCLSSESIYALVRAKSGRRWIRSLIGVGNY